MDIEKMCLKEVDWSTDLSFEINKVAGESVERAMENIAKQMKALVFPDGSVTLFMHPEASGYSKDEYISVKCDGECMYANVNILDSIRRTVSESIEDCDAGTVEYKKDLLVFADKIKEIAEEIKK